MVTSRSIQITWEPSSSSDVVDYLISYTTTASHASGGNITVDGGSTTSDILTNLEEDSLYNITVQATTSNNVVSIPSNEVSVRTYTDGKRYVISCQAMTYYITLCIVPSSPPQGVMVTSVNPASLIVKFQQPPLIDHNGAITDHVINGAITG